MHRTQVQPAKSNKSKCKKCQKVIEKGDLRAKMVDDRKFRQYLRRHPNARGSEGYSRGYFETGTDVISIHKYYVHLNCYYPIYPHPKQQQYFKLLSGKANDRQKFREWLQQQNEQQKHKKKKQSVPKPKKESSSSKLKPKSILKQKRE